MANYLTNEGRYLLANQQLNLVTDDLAWLLADSTHADDPDDSFVDEAGATDVVDAEINRGAGGTGYVAGFGGSGRKGLGNPVLAKDDAGDRATLDVDDPTWGGLDTPEDISHIYIIRRGSVDDTDAVVVAHIDQVVDSQGARDLSVNPIVTNGSDVTLQIQSILMEL